MNNSNPIQFLSHHQIDKQQWDACITACTHRLIYARAFYLDHMIPRWEALAGANYDWVLPITRRSKFGISYLYQPPFIQQLGVFAKPGIIVPYTQIIEYLQQQYKFWEISFNYTTPADLGASALQVTSATNFILDLSSSYQNIASNFHADLVKNLVRSKRFQHRYQATDDYQKCIQLYRHYYGNRLMHVKENDYNNFTAMCAQAQKEGMLVCREVVNEEGTLLATALLLFDERRLYNLMNTTTAEGRRNEANHFLLNAIIESFSEQAIVFDFDGSDLPGVRAFYKNFGALNQPYYRLKYNRLPMPFKLLKK